MVAARGQHERRNLAGGVVPTPAGPLKLVFDLDDAVVFGAAHHHLSDVVTRLRIPYTWHGETASVPASLADPFDAYGDGQIEALDGIVGLQEGDSFRQAVWRTLRGQHRPVSYGQLAELAGYPRAARAVGTACANNLIALVVPCHRVIRADGGLGNYGTDIQIKRRLLAHEARYMTSP
ncbi:MAG: methylated-DNA--[protein]-cysteine S-methyltransferase [Bifidobacteriaceae bacterium]|jgi:methylated-DNA-[protein]-cysteine S-methyltransferase|nr:methylated-DNA--[protein]-cysteine S-methyltransferase [Bifidobacteriaceae bacterium]